jgi:opacity protein-like surface antigen/outer membrane protease
MYVGLHMGGAWGEAHVSDPFGPSIFGDNIRTPGPLAGGQAGANFQFGSTVAGIEVDLSAADLDGTNTCFAFSGFYISANCRSHTTALSTLTGRLGWAVGPQGRTLLYGKAGLAWERNSVDATAGGGVGGFLPGAVTGTSGSRFGWTVGGGVEYALSGFWSVKAEYDYLKFGSENFTSPASGFQIALPATFIVVPGLGASVSQDIHEFKVGLNYKFGGTPAPLDPAWGSIKDRSVRSVAGTEIEIGGRYVHGWGRFQKDLGIQGLPVNNLASRLTYDDMRTNGGEVVARIDTSNNIMVKGFLGAGSGDSGKMNDEDWFIPPLIVGLNGVPYSNTVSDVDNRIRYGTIDVGYDFLRGPSYKMAGFVGYNQFNQNMKALGCTQIANPNSDCSAANPFNPPVPTSVLTITEDDTWKSIRLGVAADFMLLPRVKVSADAAYLPYVWFNGTDNHVLRALVSPEEGHGRGAQLDLTISYEITDQFSLGVGGRYWTMSTTSGETNFGGLGIIIPQKFAAEQAAFMLQGSYKFGDSCCAGALK